MMALVFVPPSPPGVAEYAPSAEEAIEEAREDQSSRFGAGSGDCPAGMVCDPVTGGVVARADGQPLRESIERARVRRCVGDPPRQTEDPQSPPCVSYWEGDNGGVTTKGVTRDEIRIAAPMYSDIVPHREEIVRHFNSRYEFYGRQLLLIHNPKSGGRPDPAKQRADAVRADEEFRVFASMHYDEFNDSAYSQELARRQIIYASGEPSETSTDEFQRDAPFVWGLGPPIDVLQRNLVEVSCKSLIGRSARHAGADMSQTRRKFALLILRESPSAASPDVRPLTEGFLRCGEEMDVYDMYAAAPESEIDLMLAKLQAEGVTSVIPVGQSCCGNAVRTTVMPRASLKGYYPEWLLMGSGKDYVDAFWNQQADQAQHLFGLFAVNRHLPYTDEPWYWAVKEENAEADATNSSSRFQRQFYRSLLILSAGIQLAGPKLTPGTFAAGLQKASFPNPGAGKQPYFQAGVGFARDGHTMVKDIALFWWSESAPGYTAEAPNYQSAGATATSTAVHDGRSGGVRTESFHSSTGRSRVVETPRYLR